MPLGFVLFSSYPKGRHALGYILWTCLSDPSRCGEKLLWRRQNVNEIQLSLNSCVMKK